MWHSEAERAGGLEVDDQLKFDRLFHRQVRGLGALQDVPNVMRYGTTVGFGRSALSAASDAAERRAHHCRR